MAALKKDPLRALRPEERSHLERLSRALGLPAALARACRGVSRTMVRETSIWRMLSCHQ